MARPGTLEIRLLGDTKDLNRALGKAESSLSKFAKGAAAGFAGVGIIAGGVFAKAFGDALEGEQIEDRLEASLSPTSKIAGEAGEIASRVYAGAWGDSLGEVADAVGVVASTLTDLDATGVEEATQKAFDLANAFEVDIGEAVNTVGVLLNTGLVKDSEQAFDLITRAFQEVPAEMRQELPQILEEYSHNFAEMGITGPEAFGLIVDAASDGRFALDKTGDAIKEFSILAAEEGGKASEAIESIGLDAGRMADMVATGGDDAREALGLIVDGLIAIEDPSEQAARAIDIFGAPVEDLGVQKIPEFLRRLDEMPGGMENVEGASRELGDTLNENLRTRWESALNTARDKLAEWVDNSILPKVEQVLDAFNEDGLGGAIDKLRELWDAAWPSIEAWWNNVALEWINGPLVDAMTVAGEALGRALVDGLVSFLSNWLEAEIREEIEDLNNLLPSGLQIDVGTTSPGRSGNPLPYIPPGSTTPGSLVPDRIRNIEDFHSGGVSRGGLANLADKERVLSQRQTASFDRLVGMLDRGGSMGGNITINMPPGSDGDDVVRALRRYNSRNGPVPISVSG